LRASTLDLFQLTHQAPTSFGQLRELLGWEEPGQLLQLKKTASKRQGGVAKTRSLKKSPNLTYLTLNMDGVLTSNLNFYCGPESSKVTSRAGEDSPKHPPILI
jgi:hypothetical protein